MSDSLGPHGPQPTRLLSPWSSPGKNTGVGSHFLLQGISQIQGSNSHLLCGRQILYRLSHQGGPLISSLFQFPPEQETGRGSSIANQSTISTELTGTRGSTRCLHVYPDKFPGAAEYSETKGLKLRVQLGQLSKIRHKQAANQLPF